MEGTGELNETLEDSVEAPHVKRKENEHCPQPDNCNVVESSAMSVSQETDWSERLSLSRFPELIVDTFEGNHLVRCTSSHSGSEHLGTNPCSMNDADTMVEEFTLRNHKNPNLPLRGRSSSGEEMPVKKSLWHNLFKHAGEPRDAVAKEPSTLCNKEDVENSFLKHVWAERPMPHEQLGQNYSKVSDNLIENDNHTSSNAVTRFPMGIRTKVLPASGLPQFLVKNSLKGKGIAYRYPGTHGDAPGAVVHSHTNERASGIAGKNCDKSHNSSGKAEDMSFYGGGGGSESDPYSQIDGVSLRDWLKGGRHKINKSGRLLIFKQILVFVDGLHSQGVALRHLRPSFFMITSSSQVKYVGSFIPQVQVELPAVANDLDTVSSDHQIKRKRHLELGKKTHEFMSAKHKKHSEHLKFSSQHYLLGPRGGWKGDPIKEIDISSFKAWNSGCDFREQLKIDKDHNPSYLIGDPISSGVDRQQPIFDILQSEEWWYASPEELSDCVCPFTSNIYSLGVLLFELFCYFETWEVHAAAMSDLRHRILPPNFLSESPKEAGFCLWLLHPEPSSRPKSREILLCDLISGTQDLSSADHASASIDEEDTEAELLSHFLLSVKEKKEKQAAKLMEDIGYLRADINDVERRHSSRMEFLSNARDSVTIFNDISHTWLHNEPLHSDPMSNMNESRLMKNIDELKNAYFSMRSQIDLPATNAAARSDKDVLKNCDRWSPIQNSANGGCADKESDCLGAFFGGMCKYARYSKFEVCGTLRNGDILNSANVIFSLSFDRDEEYFAAAGVSKKIKIYEFSSLLKDNVDIHYPVVEMSSKSRLSCVCWNSYIKNYLASTDYDGVVQLWDAATGQGFTQYREHQRRAWSVDFSQVDPTILASGSDDCTVKLWSINEKNCTDMIRNIANVCCVQFSSHSSHLLAFGSADYKIYCYDLRNTRIPWCTLAGHGKAVSYVKFVDSQTLVSASTDNTLKLWDLYKTSSSGLSTNACSLTLSGHTNEKNFVGLSVSDGYIACGSETNEVFAYYKSLPMPITSHQFGSIDPISGQETDDDNGQFVSSVCWRGKSSMVVAANSSGTIKLLQMA